MKKFLPVLVFAILFVAPLQAQEPVLPNYLTENEKSILPNYTFGQDSRTPAPTGPVRTMAEWEEVEYLVVTWQPSFPNILRQIVEAAVEECKVIITTQNETSVANYLSSNGVDLTNITFMDVDWDSIWIRDYAGNTIYSDDVGERALVDWIYNRPRPNDDVMPSSHATTTGLPIYITDSGTNDLVNTGGNFMSDGMGNAFASELILEENEPGNPYGVTPKTEAEIDQIMEDYMGISTYIKMTALPYDVIHHIDMHMKLLDEETLLVSKYPEGVADGPQIEANIDYVLSNFQSTFGTPYDVKWIDAPPSSSGLYPDNGGYYRTFTNATFVNKTILVPIYRPEVDGPALAQWEEMMPGYTIVGIDVDNQGENLISQVGAIHCITHTIGVADPLWIVHQKIDEAEANTTVPVEAQIKHISGIASASVFWKEETAANWTETAMTAAGTDMWTADITIPNTEENIQYYISAEANSGKTQVRPIVAPEGYWTMNLGGVLNTNSFENAIVAGPFPNPANNTVSFGFDSDIANVQVVVHNVLGQELMNSEYTLYNGSLTVSLPANWSGTLFFSLTTQKGTTVKKVLKQ
ncbi:agmatine deiminase family protein [Marinirhabdus gelatinilytica]|uniref:Putative secreted protein (Por secretion system target) n=1 Tax=Marinirhabdus gelatinilytica TaxID=1703343 RepID=A0A370QKE7_9FLAO|nr:agmatine deiminase family protein [Marinirhabdus gelatinilytica]RDK88816.1 putative secreted protein (Por secretion system target) [Marinirhabdus gelatinilytica]